VTPPLGPITRRELGSTLVLCNIGRLTSLRGRGIATTGAGDPQAEAISWRRAEIASLSLAMTLGHFLYYRLLGDYEEDLRSAIRSQGARLVVYASRGLHHVGMLCPNTVPALRLGGSADKRLWVVYDADHDTIVTGYQVPGEEAIRLPRNAQWLK